MGSAASSFRLGKNDHWNTSQCNDSRSKNQESEGPIDMLSMPNTEQAIEKGENAQPIHGAEQTEKKRRANECIAAWFSEAGIPFNTACLKNFDSMLEAIAQCSPGLQGPSLDELDGPLLQRQVLAINDSIEVLKKSWVSEGCSILAYKEIGDDGRLMLNMAIDCSHGMSFLRSIQLPSESYGPFVSQQIDSCIEEVGEKNVVQVIGDIDTTEKLLTKRQNIFWTHCAASSIEMILQEIFI